MPESVGDRCTKSHEYIFLLTKSPKYFFDADAIKEPAIYAGDDRGARKDSRRGTKMNSMSSKTGEFRNKRSVWKVATKPFRGAHFAVFPPDLIEPCILAGTSAGGCCANCGMPLSRISVEGADDQWVAGCACGTSETVPCTVMDTFFGSGTTGVVAMRHGRKFIGCELNPEYAAIATGRLAEEEARLAHLRATAQLSLF
jgi:DNA modification methylase